VRYQGIFLLLSGEPRHRIATILNRGLDMIGFYIQAYCKDGLEGLEIEHSPGRPKRMTADQEQALYLTIVDKKPGLEKQETFKQEFEALKKIAATRNGSNLV